jgi:hypothetical protein
MTSTPWAGRGGAAPDDADEADHPVRQRLAGTMPDGATRRVSLHDGDARPIAKGRLGRPVEFGYKAQVTDNDDGVVLDYTVEQGNPADGPQLAPAIGRVIRRTGKKPRTVTADRGYGEKSIEDDLRALGVRHVAIPRKGKPGKGPPGRRTTARVPAGRQMADRQRRPHQHPQTAIRMGPHPPGRQRRSPDLDRIRDPGPQPGQDQHTGQLTPALTDTGPASTTCPNSARRLFQVEVARHYSEARGERGPRLGPWPDGCGCGCVASGRVGGLVELLTMVIRSPQVLVEDAYESGPDADPATRAGGRVFAEQLAADRIPRCVRSALSSTSASHARSDCAATLPQRLGHDCVPAASGRIRPRAARNRSL